MRHDVAPRIGTRAEFARPTNELSPMNTDLRRSYSLSRSGSEDHFIQVVKRYEALVFGFFRVSAPSHLTEAMSATQQVFFQLWEGLNQHHRIGDFERALVNALIAHEFTSDSESSDPRIQALAQLSRRDRVIALAVEIGNWTVESAAHSLDVSRAVMARDLLRIRCDLIGLHFINLTEDEKRVLREMSSHLCRDVSKKHRRKMTEATCRSPELRNFKALCLEKRCEMVELWLDFRLTPEEQSWLFEGVLGLISREKEKRAAAGYSSLSWLPSFRRRKKVVVS